MSQYDFSPDIPSDIGEIKFSPYMIECAYHYYATAIKSSHNSMYVKSIISALAIEIVLKSYNSTPSDNFGKIDETYEFKKKEIGVNDQHNLQELADKIPENIRKFLLSDNDIEIINANAMLFKESRYFYEKNASQIYFDDIIDMACDLVCKTIYLYKEKGCKDTFITTVNVNDIYFSHKKRFL